MTRLQTLKAKGLTPDLPHPGLAEHLVGYLFAAGPTSHTGMGGAPLGWQDILAWQQSTGVELQAWEARALRSLSHDYLVAQQDATDPDSPAPYTTEITEDRRALVSSSVRNIFGSRKTH